MKITIVGGGNIGTQFAVHCAEAGHDVKMFTSTPQMFEHHLMIVGENGEITHEGDISLATNDPDTAFREAELIFITMPPTQMEWIAQTITQNIGSAPMIGVVPGNGGWECAFRACIERGCVFFGIERVPAIARLVRKGKTVRSVGYRSELHVASLPASRVGKCCEIIQSVFGIPTCPIPSYLNLTMTPSNPILHTTRLRTIFRDWHPGVIYDYVPLFYEEWDDASSTLLIACDEEVQEICRQLPEFQLGYVKSLRIHYESPTVEDMTRKISSITAFKGLPTPAVKTDEGYIPDLQSRYFTADFSYGLSVIQQIARLTGISTPNIDATILWYKKIAVSVKEFSYAAYGIRTRNELEQFYLQ